MEEIMNDKWISIDEAAEYLGIKTVTLRSWIRNGKEGLPAQKIGKQWKFKISEVDEWIRSGGADEQTDKTKTEDTNND